MATLYARTQLVAVPEPPRTVKKFSAAIAYFRYLNEYVALHFPLTFKTRRTLRMVPPSSSAAAEPAASSRAGAARRHALSALPCLVTGVLTLALVLALYLAQPAPLQQLDRQAYDLFLRLTAGGEPPPGIVIVDIDEKSIASLGQWPWPRYLVAALLENLDSAGASAIGLDILFSEADRTSVSHVRSMLKRFMDLDMTVQGLPDEVLDNDAILADALAATPSVVSMYLRFGAERAPLPAAPLPAASLPAAPGLAVRELEAPAPGVSPTAGLITAGSATLPLPAFSTAAPVAFYNAALDSDGLLRRMSLVIAVQEKIYAGLALRTLMLARGVSALVLETGADGTEGVRVGDLVIPVSPDGTMPVLFRGPGRAYPYVSAVDLLSGKADASLLRGAIVFVGTSAAGLRDIRATPFDRNMAGVEVHAAVVDSILSGRFLSVPPWTPGLQCLGILFIGLACALLFGRARAFVYAPLALGLAGAVIWSTASCFQNGLFVSPVYLLLTVAGEGFTVLSLRFRQEERQKRHLRQAFSRYVAPEVVARIARYERDILAGEERVITILFSDIRGFTGFSETLRPEQLVRLLNSYFTPMTALVRSSRGTLDKFIGDALMAFWNAPLDVPGHAVLAVDTALRMQETLASLNDTLHAQCGQRIAIGVGLHTGRAYVGNMGSEELLDYTAIGDAVNLTSRMEGLCSQYRVGITVSGDTAALCAGEFVFQHVDTLRVKGKKAPVDVFTPLRPAEAARRSEELDAYARARALYTSGDFCGAASAFAELRRAHDVGLYALYAERCEKLALAPPSEWDCIWSLVSK